MSEITYDAVTEIRDPKVLALARRVLSNLRTAAARVTANAADPGRHALPSNPRSFEHVLHARLRALPADRQRRAAERVASQLSQRPLRERILGSNADLDLRSTASVAELTRPRIVPADLGLTRDYITKLRPGAAASAGFRPLQTLKNLELRLHRVRCIDETDPEYLSSDKMTLGAIGIDESGDTHQPPRLALGEYGEDGARRTFNPPKQIATFNVLEGTAWPKGYFVTLVLCEQDNGGFPEFMKKIYEGVKDEVVTALAAAIGGAIGASGGPVTMVIGTAVGWCVGELYASLKNWWEDDEFEPLTLQLTHGGIGGRFEQGSPVSKQFPVVRKGHGGTYELTCDWRLY